MVAGAWRLFPELLKVGRVTDLQPVQIQRATDEELIEKQGTA